MPASFSFCCLVSKSTRDSMPVFGCLGIVRSNCYANPWLRNFRGGRVSLLGNGQEPLEFGQTAERGVQKGSIEAFF
jgi:hypothetical protein